MTGLVPFANTLGSIGFDNFFDGFFKPFTEDYAARFTGPFRVDVREDNQTYYVDAELPGMPKEDISVSLTDKKLRIEVNHEETTNEEKPAYLHRERYSMSAARSVYLPEAKGSEIVAKLENGILNISVPKAQPSDTTCNVTIQ